MSVPFELSIEKDRVLRGDWFPSQASEPQATVIICHGFKGFKDWGFFPYVGEKLSERFDIITFNFSHNGIGPSLVDFTELDKFAKNTFAREVEDLAYLVKELKSGRLRSNEDRPAPQQLFLLGHSRGAAVSCIYAFDHPQAVNGVVSWNGLLKPDSLFTKQTKQEMRTDGRAYIENARTKQRMPLDREILDDLEANYDRYNIIARAANLEEPLALIQGTEDYERLLQGSEELISANPAVKWIKVSGGNHTFNAVHPFTGETEPLRQAMNETIHFIDGTFGTR
ncbi:alpha/beta hydrolase family protein [Paenibacillus tarimensis]